ncbi:MAG: aminoacyl-tRNA hydrolase [Ignavibacteriales bacterium]
MRVIFGIGNPGSRYEFTRHNAGFLLLDYFARKKSIDFKESTGDYLQASGKIGDNDFILIKPTTFVNNSGLAAKQLFDKFFIEPEQFFVICDDSNLKVGTFRVRLSGGDGGHNGLNSIIYHLTTEKFPRLRIGIGTVPDNLYLAEYVLSRFPGTELEAIQSTFNIVASLMDEFIVGGSKKMLEANSVLNKSEQQKNFDEDN